MRNVGLGFGALAVALACCGGGDDGLEAPRNLVASGPPDYLDYVVLEWDPAGGAERYELQGRVGAGAWERVDDQIPGDVVSGQLIFDAGAPEATEYGFRVRAFRGGDATGWSNEATFFRGVRPGTSFSVFDQSGALAVTVQWTQGSTQADAILLERAPVALDGSVGAWSTLPGVAPGDTSYVDTDLAGWVDGGRLAYRLTYWKNGHSSAPASGTTSQAPPLAPTALVASPAGATAIELTWTPRSVYADRLVVLRSSRATGSEVEAAELPPDASTYVDAVPSPGGYVYAVRAQAGPWSHVVNFVSMSERVLGFTAVDPAAPFTLSAPSVPPGVQVARDSAGRFGAVEWSSGAARARVPEGDGWAIHDTLAGRGLLTPAILFDPQDRPHVFTVVLNPPALADQPKHDWLDDSGWHTELPPPHRVSDLTIDVAGAIHAVSCDAALVYMSNAGGSWTTETLSANDYVNDSCQVAVGPDGDPRIAYGSYLDTGAGQVYALSWVRRESGIWIGETIPGTEGVRMDGWLFYRVLAPSTTRTAIVYEQSSIATGSTLYAAVRDSGAWGPVEQIGERPFNGQPGRYAAAAAPSGRILVAWNGWANGDSGAAGRATLRAAGGGWADSPLFDAPYGIAAGFSPDGKAWVLEGFESPYPLLYTER